MVIYGMHVTLSAFFSPLPLAHEMNARTHHGLQDSSSLKIQPVSSMVATHGTIPLKPTTFT